MPTLTITDLPPMSPHGPSNLTAHQMQNIHGGAALETLPAFPVESDGGPGNGAGPILLLPGFPQLPGAGTPGFCGTPVPLPLPDFTPRRTPGPAESPIVF